MIDIESIRVQLASETSRCPDPGCGACRVRAVLFAGLEVAEGVCGRRNTKVARQKFRRALHADELLQGKPR